MATRTCYSASLRSKVTARSTRRGFATRRRRQRRSASCRGRAVGQLERGDLAQGAQVGGAQIALLGLTRGSMNVAATLPSIPIRGIRGHASVHSRDWTTASRSLGRELRW